MTHPLPRIAIVGRPNVGKSTLFNRLIGKKLALVDDTPGVTRDRREGQGQLFDLNFTLIDTAGFEDADAQSLSGRMRLQTQAAVHSADLALFVIDARAGITPLDVHFAQWLRAQTTPVLLLANKAEGRAAEAGLLECFQLGLGEPVAFSAEHGEGLADLFAAVAPLLKTADLEEDGPLDDAPVADPPLALAIVGRPNAGKSTLINHLLGEERLVTGPEAGITRDSIAVPWEWQGKPVKLVDTAGLRKRARVVEKLERLSVADAKRAIDFAEVVVLLLDGTLGLEGQDLRIADLVLQEGRALIVALNKWDIVAEPGPLYRGVAKALEEGLAQIKGVPLLTLSGATGKGLDGLLNCAFEQREGWSRRIATAKLNRWFEHAIERNPPPAPGGKRIKLRYITQARTRPPTFVVWGNRTEDLPESYRRYLINGLRAEMGFTGVPIRLTFRANKNPFDQ
jgi:GTPase